MAFCVNLPPNVLRQHTQHASRSRSRPFMMATQTKKISPPPNRSLVNKSKLCWSLFVFPVLPTGTFQCNFWFGRFVLLLSVSQASVANCCLLQLHAWGGGGCVSLFTPSVSVDHAELKPNESLGKARQVYLHTTGSSYDISFSSSSSSSLVLLEPNWKQ